MTPDEIKSKARELSGLPYGLDERWRLIHEALRDVDAATDSEVRDGE